MNQSPLSFTSPRKSLVSPQEPKALDCGSPLPLFAASLLPPSFCNSFPLRVSSMPSPQHHPSHHHQDRHQQRQRESDDVTEKSGGLHSRLFRDRLHHEIGPIA